MGFVSAGYRVLGAIALFLTTYSINTIAIAKDRPGGMTSHSRLEDIRPDLPLDSEELKSCQQDLSRAIAEIIDHPHLARSRWGIEVQTLNGQVLYSLDGDKFFTPASSAKVLTTAAILSQLPANYRITTPLLAAGNPPHLTSLRLQGRGDPSISTKKLKDIVQQLQALGVQRIDKLIVDDSYFEPPTINPTWEWLDVHSYFATGVNSTILNQNTVTLTLLPQQLGQPVKYYWNDRIAARQWQVVNHGVTGVKDLPYNIEIDGDLGKPVLTIRGELGIDESDDVWELAVVDPANYFLESLRLHLTLGGIEVRQGIAVQESDADFGEEKLFEIVSPPIQQIVNEINQESNNLYAEAMAKVLTAELEIETPISAIARGLKKLGISSSEYVLVDASGLSRQNLVTPKTLVKTLSLMLRSPDNKSYLQSLSLAGVNGTLKNRFINTPIARNLWGKTGTLTGVGSLSGYLTRGDRQSVLFSIVVNNSELSSPEIRKVIDRLVKVLNHTNMC